jgi:hypothetical protein
MLAQRQRDEVPHRIAIRMLRATDSARNHQLLEIGDENRFERHRLSIRVTQLELRDLLRRRKDSLAIQ